MRESANLKQSTEDAMNIDSKSHSPSIAVDSNNSNKRLKPNQETSTSNKVDESNKSSLDNIDRNQVPSLLSNLVAHASPSIQAPLNSGVTKDIRLVKLSDKAWMCDVCKRAVFENFVEACMHEIACKSMKNSRRNSSEASLNINVMSQLARRNSFTYGQAINCSSTGGSHATLPSNGPIVFPGVAAVASYTNSLNRNSMHNLNGMIRPLKMVANPAPGPMNQAVFSAVHGNHLASSVNSGSQGKIISLKHDSTDTSISSPSKIVTHSGSDHDVSSKSAVKTEMCKADNMALTLDSDKSIEIKSDSLNAGVSVSSNSGTSVTSYSSAKSHEESSDESKEENDGTQVDISLIPENKNLLSDYNYLLTKNIELFQVPLSFNVAQMNGIMAEELPATKVGLRCIHCSSNERQITASSFFPSSVSSMASGIGTIGSRHMIGGKCPLLPKSVLHELKEAKLNSQQQSRIPGKVALDAYCKDLAKSHKIFDHEFGGIYVAVNESIRKQLLVEAVNAAETAPLSLSNHTSKEQHVEKEFNINEEKTIPTRRSNTNTSDAVSNTSKDLISIDKSDTTAFVPGTIEHFWECKHCNCLPFHWRASGSVIFSAGPLEHYHVEKHLEACQGKKPLYIPRDAKISLKNEMIQVTWNRLRKGLKRKLCNTSRPTTILVDDAPKVSSVSDSTTLNINRGVEDGCLALPEDKTMTTDYAWFTVAQLKKCYLTKAGGSRGNCPIGYPGLACRFCSGTLNERRFFYTSADHLRNSFSHIPSHLLTCSEAPSDIKEKIEEYKSFRSKQKTQLKAGDHKEFIDNVWLRLHGPGGGHVEQKSEDEEVPKVGLRKTEDNLDDISIEFQSEGDDFHSMSIDGKFLESKEINAETSNCIFLHMGDRKTTTDYVYFSLLQMKQIELCAKEDGRVIPYIRKTRPLKANENIDISDGAQSCFIDTDEKCENEVSNNDNEMHVSTSNHDLDLESELDEPKVDCDTSKLEDSEKLEKMQHTFTSIVCKHCETNFDTTPLPFLPKSAEELRLNFSEIPKHLISCKSCPDKVKTTLQLLRASRGVQEALLKKGSQNKFFKMVWGRIEEYCENRDEHTTSVVNESVSDPGRYTPDVLTAELLQDSDRSLVTEYTFYTMQQMDPVVLESSGNGSRSMFQNGFPGLACKHCSGKPHARKFFYRTSEILSGNYAHIPNHVLSCKYAPFEVKKTLAEKKKDHQAQKSRLSRGSQRVFFNHIWDRLHCKRKELQK